ncbi:MAG: YbaB/EbfC family nucleoid-associated protein [Oscillospiraceae bacterium]|nr:YbaB/EbfC family nucleoid-associated protein [Oscillospiraceae bacterium]
MPKNFSGGGGFNANMMKQVQKMQQDMLRTQTELEERVYTAASGGGAVSVTVNGKHEVTELSLNPDVVDRDDVEMLQDLIITAVNAAMKEADETAAREMGKFTGGMNLPF